MREDKYRKIKIECSICKSQFEILILEMNYSPEMEKRIRNNFYQSCPVCRTLKEIQKQKPKHNH